MIIHCRTVVLERRLKVWSSGHVKKLTAANSKSEAGRQDNQTFFIGSDFGCKMAYYLSTSTIVSEDDFDTASGDIWWPILSGEEAEKMVPYSLAPGEKIIMCPYDKCHWIRLSRTNHHLYRCRKNYYESCKTLGIVPEKVQCRFSSTHMLELPEKIFHEFQCSFKEKSEDEHLKDIEKYAPKLHQDPYSVIRPEEEWHVDPNTKSYDPRGKLKSEAFLIPQCNSIMNKTEKKIFQDTQRWHFYTRGGDIWKGLGNEEPEMLNQPIVLPEGNDLSVSEILAELSMDDMNTAARPSTGLQESEEAPLPDGQCIQFINSFFSE